MLFMCAHEYMYTSVCMHVRDQMSKLGVFLYHPAPYLLGEDLLLIPELTSLARMAS